MGRFQTYVRKTDEDVFAEFEQIAKSRSGVAEETARLIRAYVAQNAPQNHSIVRIHCDGRVYEGLMREVGSVEIKDTDQ